MPVWFGAGNDATNRVARERRRDDQPLGRVSPTRARDDADGRGQLGRTGAGGSVDARSTSLRDAGATWAVCTPRR